MKKNNRPLRLRLNDASGKITTLNSGPQAFVKLNNIPNAQEHIILGHGPLIHEDGMPFALPLESLIKLEQKVFFLECPEFIHALNEKSTIPSPPEHWQKVSENELMDLVQGKNIWWYRQNMQFNPEYWAKILGIVQANILRGSNVYMKNKSIIVAGNNQQLLHKEICLAFEELGYAVHAGKKLQSVLEHEQPSLFFSINLHGLDVEGSDFTLMQGLNIPVAIWFVDNPWHILSSLRLPWWKDAKLFVTDASFIPELQKQGAKNVYHLPLAASQHMWKRDAIKPTQAVQAAQNAACTFVGRASFPDNAKFFAAAKVDDTLQNEAFTLLDAGGRPDFNWWQEKLKTPTWPGHEVRCVGLGAENCSCRHRVLWLRELLPLRPAIYGDSDSWQKYLPEADAPIFQADLDYYTELKDVYASAHTVLNVTSLLLPQGLTQRHFDVWAAGGFLFSDHTAGLHIFPQELTTPIIIEHPSKIMSKILTLDLMDRQDLIVAWQELIRNEHSYAKRVSLVLEACS